MGSGGAWALYVTPQGRVVSVNETEERCPLVVEFGEGQRGIAEPEWLMEVAGA